MRISSVVIEDVLGTEYASFKPRSITVLRGANGSGKSSIITALTSLFDGGHDPSMIRVGAKKGKITLTLSDGTTITKTITPTRGTVEIMDASGNIVAAPQTFINRMTSAMAVDPVRLLTAKPKDLVATLLDVMPIEFTPADVASACDIKVDNTIDMDGLEKLRKHAYEQRSRENVSVRDSEGTLKQLCQSLPEDDGKDWDAALMELEAEALGLSDKIAVAKDRVKAQARLTGTKALIETTRLKIRNHNIASDKLSRDIGALDDLKKQKLDSLPVPGIEVLGDKVLVDGVEWSHVNTARRVDIACQVAALSAEQLPFMVVDNAEMMDEETWAEFLRWAKENNRQVIAARVSNDWPLKIEVEEAVAA